MGELYLAGKGVMQSPVDGWNFLQRAAAGGNVQAMAVMGYMLTRGMHTAPDPEQGKVWLRKASALGSPIAGRWLDNSEAANYIFGE
ncbi:hypothetical protein NHH73_00740 [Oxalobacteraceae bacterium OTU3CINTB1]|nr:hypothetical protein NHH73_00740 [Oxalobacteraceae bacterium OTU3CINTB1]